jgi:hypothetical protein
MQLGFAEHLLRARGHHSARDAVMRELKSCVICPGKCDAGRWGAASVGAGRGRKTSPLGPREQALLVGGERHGMKALVQKEPEVKPAGFRAWVSGQAKLWRGFKQEAGRVRFAF